MSESQGEKPRRGFKDTAQRWQKALDRPLTFMALAFGIAASYFAVIEWRVRSIVKDPDFVAEVARRTRPAMVFDSEGRVLADTGVLTFLEGVPKVETGVPGRFDTRITVRPKTVLPAEPIIQSLDEGNVSVTAKKIQGTAWEILVTPRSIFLATQDAPTNLAPPRFRLEIVAP